MKCSFQYFTLLYFTFNTLQGPLRGVQVLCHQVREWSLNENDDSEDPLGVWDLHYEMITLQNKVAAVMIYHPLLLMCLPTTKLGFIAPFIAVLSHCPSWLNSQLIGQSNHQASRQVKGGQNQTFSRSPLFKCYVYCNKIQMHLNTNVTKYET